MPIQINNALTAARVKQEKRPGRYADGNGLYLHVSETGARWWPGIDPNRALYHPAISAKQPHADLSI